MKNEMKLTINDMLQAIQNNTELIGDLIKRIEAQQKQIDDINKTLEKVLFR